MNFYDITHRYTSICKCGKCGGDALVDDSMVLTSMPPKYNYECLDCGHHGYIDCGETVLYYSDKLPEEIKEKIKKLIEKKNPNIHFVGESVQSLNGNGETISVPKKGEKITNPLNTNHLNIVYTPHSEVYIEDIRDVIIDILIDKIKLKKDDEGYCYLLWNDNTPQNFQLGISYEEYTELKGCIEQYKKVKESKSREYELDEMDWSDK